MGPRLRGAFEQALRSAREAEAAGEHARAFRQLERAHVLSQAFAGPHVRVHVRMLGFGWRRGDLREVVGQLARLLLAAPGSLLGRAPRGNTGSADVGMFTPMATTDDLQALLAADARDR